MREDFEEPVEVEERVVVEHVYEPRSSGEMLRFFVLVIVLGATVLVVAMARPLIFGKIVPAVMGEGIVIPTDVPVVEETQPVEEEEPIIEEVEEGAVEEETAVETEATGEETVVEEASGEETAAPVTEGATDESGRDEAATSEVTTDGQTIHRVRQGETLQTIAAQYGVTMQALIEANKLTNPDLIKIGDELVIPKAAEQP
jgi:LysM repeat protein